MKPSVSRRFLARIEKLMGAPLSQMDLSFLNEDLPLDELELLRQMASVDSSTLNKTGVESLQNQVSAELESLGFRIRMTPGDPRFAPLIVAERAGRQRSFITLITHTDTVLPNYREFAVDVVAQKAYGSGVIDNKGGVVVGLAGLKRFLSAHPETEYSLRFICSPNEEVGSIGFTEIFRELGQDSAVGFGLEPALDNGSIINQRRGNRWYNIDIKGREAHAGRSYGHHVNAAHDLASKIRQVSELTNYRKHISVNVGHFEGGQNKHNIICGSAHAKIDVRFPSFEARDYLHKKIETIMTRAEQKSVCGQHESTTRIEIVDDCPPIARNRRSKKMSRMYAALVSQIEKRKISAQNAGGAGDVNYLCHDRNVVLDGLGPVGGEMHTRDEHLWIPSLKSRSQALAGFLRHLQTTELDY